MAPMAARLAAARRMARHPWIKVSAVEARLGTRYAVDTVAALVRRHPHTRFVWLMGADNLEQLHRWSRWRDLARLVPIAVLARPRYSLFGLTAPAMAWFRRWRRVSARARRWREWELPAIVMLDIRTSPLSATAIRARDPDWAAGTAPVSPLER